MYKNVWPVFFILFSLCLMVMSKVSSALPFNIVPKAGTQLPTVIKGSYKITAYYTVSNNTLAPRNNNFVKYLPINTTQVTTGGTYPDTCPALFNLSGKGQPGDSCTLQLSISGTVNSNDPNPHHHLFVCFPGGLSCAGTLFPLNLSESPKIAYVTNFNGLNISICPLNKDGSFGACSLTENLPFQPAGITLNLNPKFTYITLPNVGGILYCPINSDGNLGSCTPVSSIFPTPSGIAVNPVGTSIYITNPGNALVSRCPINNDGSISPCEQAGFGFNSPFGIAFNSSGTVIYITDPFSPDVQSCNLDGLGNLINCISNTDQALDFPYAITINQANTLAYVVNGSGSVAYCTIQNNGTFGTCTPTGNGFDFPVGITLDSAGTFAYIANENGNTVSACPINIDGSFGTCFYTGTGFDNPGGIAIF